MNHESDKYVVQEFWKDDTAGVLSIRLMVKSSIKRAWAHWEFKYEDSPENSSRVDRFLAAIAEKHRDAVLVSTDELAWLSYQGGLTVTQMMETSIFTHRESAYDVSELQDSIASHQSSESKQGSIDQLLRFSQTWIPVRFRNDTLSSLRIEACGLLDEGHSRIYVACWLCYQLTCLILPWLWCRASKVGFVSFIFRKWAG